MNRGVEQCNVFTTDWCKKVCDKDNHERLLKRKRYPKWSKLKDREHCICVLNIFNLELDHEKRIANQWDKFSPISGIIRIIWHDNHYQALTTGYRSFAECRPLKHSVKGLPSVTLGKPHLWNFLTANGVFGGWFMTHCMYRSTLAFFESTHAK